MRAFVITAPGQAGVADVEPPRAIPGEVVVDVALAGVCGTDTAFFTGEMSYLHTGLAAYPMRIGHEWMGTVTALGEGVDRSWLGRRVTGDTMLGCGVCRLCTSGRQHVCEARTEIGVRGGRPGALADRIAVPASALRALPDTVDDALGALAEPGGNALRAVQAAALQPGDRVLILGPGTIGLMTAMFARAAGAEVHLLGRSARSLEFARSLGFDDVWSADSLPPLPWRAVVNASDSADQPAAAIDLVEPGGRVVCVGLANAPSLVDMRTAVVKDVTTVGILSGSPALTQTIEAFADGRVDPRPLIAATVPLDGLAAVLEGARPPGGPKVHVAIAA